MSFLRRSPILSVSHRLSLSNRLSVPHQTRSYSHCNYNENKPTFTPFFASLFVGGLFNWLIFHRMNLDIHYQYREFEQVKADLKEIKGILEKKK
jgi:hypothetical protein